MEETKRSSLNLIPAHFSSPIIADFDDKFISVDIDETNLNLIESGKPVLPKVVKTFEIPFGAKNIEVTVEPKDIYEQEITKKVRPGS